MFPRPCDERYEHLTDDLGEVKRLVISEFRVLCDVLRRNWFSIIEEASHQMHQTLPSRLLLSTYS